MLNETSLSTIIIDNKENSKQCNKNKANKKWNGKKEGKQLLVKDMIMC